jgi:hypothetical protein
MNSGVCPVLGINDPHEVACKAKPSPRPTAATTIDEVVIAIGVATTAAVPTSAESDAVGESGIVGSRLWASKWTVGPASAAPAS